MDFIEDDDGNLFIAINNKNNKFCYHVVVLQYLHSSKTLNNFIRNYNLQKHNSNELIYNLLLPLKTYSEITKSNYKNIYEKLKNDYDIFINKIVDDFAKNGYYPEILLCQIFIPVLFHIMDFSLFETILKELKLKKLRFCQQSYKLNEIINQTPFLKPQFRNEIYKYNIDFINVLDKLNLPHEYSFKCGIVEVYPHLYDCDNGHALFILKNGEMNYFINGRSASENYFIFDDSNYINKFNDYVIDRKYTIHKMLIHNIDEKTVNDLKTLWGNNIMTKRINDRYEFMNFYNDKMENENEISGGTLSITGGGKINVWLIIAIVLLLILIIESIFAIINHNKYKNCTKQSYTPTYRRKEPCPCGRG